MVNDLLVIRCNMQMHPDKLSVLRRNIEKQRESGTILLPCYCDALLVPKDTAIGWLNEYGFPAINMMEDKHD